LLEKRDRLVQKADMWVALKVKISIGINFKSKWGEDSQDLPSIGMAHCPFSRT
jgi:hypothetical protein